MKGSWRMEWVRVVDENGVGNFTATGDKALRLCTQDIDTRWTLEDRNAAPPELVALIDEALKPQPMPGLVEEPELHFEAPPGRPERRVWTPTGRDPSTPAPAEVQAHRFVTFCRDEANTELWPAQQELAVEILESPARIIPIRVGRQSGKTTLGALLAAWTVTVAAPDHLAHVRPGERPVVLLLANNKDQADELLKKVRALFEQPALAGYLVDATGDRLTIKSGIDVLALSTSGRSARGRTSPLAIHDEMAHGLDDQGRPSNAAVRSLFDAVYPSLSHFRAGKYLGISTPMWPSGLYHELVQQAATAEHVETFHAPTWTIVPRSKIPVEDYVNEFARAPETARRELGAEFTSTSMAVLDEQAVLAALRTDGDLPPMRNVRYHLTIDPAFRGDRFGLIVWHVDEEGRLVVDLVRAWGGSRLRRLDFKKTMGWIVEIARAYRITRVSTDQASADAIESELRTHGLQVAVKPWNNQNKILAAHSASQRFWAGTIEIVDRELADELIALEAHPTPSGKTSISAGAGSRDDLAMTLLMTIVEADEAVRRSNYQVVTTKDHPFD